jgi:hypothetical protein
VFPARRYNGGRGVTTAGGRRSKTGKKENKKLQRRPGLAAVVTSTFGKVPFMIGTLV